MAQDEQEKHTAAEKGKAKAPATDGVDGVNGAAEPKKDKDGNVIKDEERIFGEGTFRSNSKDKERLHEDRRRLLTHHSTFTEVLSEEDQQMKTELEMLVERLQVC